MYRRRLSELGKSKEDTWDFFRSMVEGAPSPSGNQAPSSSRVSSSGGPRAKLFSRKKDDSEDSSNSSDEESFSMRGALRRQSIKRSRLELSIANSSFGSANCPETPTRSGANESINTESVSSLVAADEATVLIGSMVQGTFQNCTSGAGDMNSTIERTSMSRETDSDETDDTTELQILPNIRMQGDTWSVANQMETVPIPELRGVNSLNTTPSSDVESVELNYGETADILSDFEDAVLQNQISQRPGEQSDIESPERSNGSGIVEIESEVRLERLNDFFKSQTNETGHRSLANGAEEDEDSVSENSESDNGNAGSESEFEVETTSPNTIVAGIEKDMKSFNKLQNHEYCGTHVAVETNILSSEAHRFSRDEGTWNVIYPGCFTSQQELDGYRYGMMEICPKTIRPFEILGTRHAMFSWVLKGEIILKTNAMEHMVEDGLQVPVLRSFTFKKGDLMIIPTDVPHALVNKTDEMVRIAFSCFV